MAPTASLQPHRRARAAVAVAVAGVVLAGCARAEVRAAPAIGAKVTWKACASDPAQPQAAGLECATVAVPARYTGDGHALGTRRITLAVVRYKAADPTRRIGSLLTNPGGPGGSGVEFVKNVAALAPRALHERFDLIGIDPRGVGESAPAIHCLDYPASENDSKDDPKDDSKDDPNGDAKAAAGGAVAGSDDEYQRNLDLDPTPDTPREADEIRAFNDRTALRCAARLAALDVDFSTIAAARDLDVVRTALGDERLTFLGISYGTYLGATYATLYPQRVRAMVLDGALDLAGDDAMDALFTQVGGFEHEFVAWSAWCDANTDCPYHVDGSPTADRWDRLVRRLDARPLAADGRRLTEGAALIGTLAALYDRQAWTILADALAHVEQGDPSGLQRLADLYSGRRADGTWKNQRDANAVITCASGLGIALPPTVSRVAFDARARIEAPRLARFVVNGFYGDDLENRLCSQIRLTGPMLVPHYSGSGPVLVIGGEGDPATPLRWARELHGRLGKASKLLVWSGDGHGAFIANECATAALVRVLVEASTAKAPAHCGATSPAIGADALRSLHVEAAEEVPMSKDLTELLQLGAYHVRAFAATDAAATRAALDAGFRRAGWNDPVVVEQNSLTISEWRRGPADIASISIPARIARAIPALDPRAADALAALPTKTAGLILLLAPR